ncbi:MAG: UDP-N-acetylglucosamine 2-epimerase (non-hydrolyzing) [Crocinitomicaceae bacterium]|nr:UDP-N-acetylglucosamine 2-epimerase (non-hydrolyzing) [Crocinitomicaceae bacterium]
MKIITVIGARPQIIKAAAISRAIADKFDGKIHEIILHTGQHYDDNMSRVFFDELNVPKPALNLNVGSDAQGLQTAKMLEGIESAIQHEKPDAVLVYGDTNSTVAGGLAASKLGVPIIHIEAGMRSFNKAMPEEINRIVCDHVSTLLFCPTDSALANLNKEGFNLNSQPPYSIDNPKVYHCGDIMLDNALYFAELAEQKSTILSDLNLHENFVLATVHRQHNTDNPDRLQSIFKALLQLIEGNDRTLVLPLHPRTKSKLESALSKDLRERIEQASNFKVIPPVSYLDIIALESNADLILTDSGGVQKEAFFFKKPCVILREETEWVELVENGNAKLCGADEKLIVHATDELLNRSDFTYPPFYGDGKAAEFICSEILKHIPC